MAFVRKGGTHLVNKYGTTRTDCFITNVMSALDTEFIVIGELCYQDGINGDLYNLLSNKQNDTVLRYFVFDIVEYEGKQVTGQSLLDRKEMLIELFTKLKSPFVQLNPTYVCESKEQMEDRHRLIVEAGFEGSVLKNMDGALSFGPINWAKIKTSDVNSFPVVVIDPARERIEVMVNVALPDGRTVNRACGVKASSQQKQGLSIGDHVDIKHMGILSGGGLRHPVLVGKTKGVK